MSFQKKIQRRSASMPDPHMRPHEPGEAPAQALPELDRPPGLPVPPVPPPNEEWRLSDLVDLISAEADEAEDTLSLKSYTRGVSFAIKQISLELSVQVRRAADGTVWFRTAQPERPGASLLKLDFAQVLQSQLVATRKPLNPTDRARSVAELPGISRDELRRLHKLAIFSWADFDRYTRNAPLLAEVGFKSGIAPERLQSWSRHVALAVDGDG